MDIESFPKDLLKELYAIQDSTIRVIFLSQTVVSVRLKLARPKKYPQTEPPEIEVLEVRIGLTPDQAARLSVRLKDASEIAGRRAN